jgi:hypothetical protein
MANPFIKIRQKKAHSTQAMLVGWIWLCVIAMGGGLGFLLALSAFSPPETLTLSAPNSLADPQADLTPNLQLPLSSAPPSASPGEETQLTLPLPPAPIRVRSALAINTDDASRSLPDRVLWDGPLVVGSSVDGRPLEVYQFGTGPDRRMIVAGIHGGYEWNTVALADELIAHLQEHPEWIPTGVSLYILRVLNPDGLARGEWYEGRLNAHGVDLNRNFPSNWQAEWPNSGCWSHLSVSSGEFPASEPETQAVMDFVRDHPLTVLISYHSAFLGIFPGGIPLDLPSVELAQSVAAVTTYRYPPVDTGCAYTGTLADWAVDQGAAALDLELHTHEDTDFEENLAVLAVLLHWQPAVLSGR